ncbi:MAG: cytochrome c [Caldilineaceae bacterium]
MSVVKLRLIPGTLLLGLLLLTSCAGRMTDQQRYDPLEASSFYSDGKSARDLLPNTVARGQLDTTIQRESGLSDGAPATTFPFRITQEVLARGQERYNIYCAPCHGLDGYGDGIIVARGLTPPPSYHTDRLRAAPPGYFFTVISNGFGSMYSYRDRIPPEDRWAIIAYIRALQRSQNATSQDVPAEEQGELTR